jgi:hypothetical protein
MWSLGYTQVLDKSPHAMQDEHNQMSSTNTESTLDTSQSSRLLVQLDKNLSMSESTSPLIDPTASPDDSTTPTTTIETNNFFPDDFNASSAEAFSADEAATNDTKAVSSPEPPPPPPPINFSSTEEKSEPRPVFFTDVDEENEAKLDESGHHNNDDHNDSTVVISEPRQDSSNSEIEDDFVMIEPADRFPDSSQTKSKLKPGNDLFLANFSSQYFYLDSIIKKNRGNIIVFG